MTSSSIQDTFKIAKNFAKKIKNPSIILLKGDLGAGKTHFVKGMAQGMKIKTQVTSPTFTIMNQYEGGRLPIYHFDMYRLTSKEEALEAGLGEYFDTKTLNGVSVVEWPENVKGLIRGKVTVVTITKLGDENKREIEIQEEEC